MTKDSSGHEYQEIAYPNGDQLRITLVEDGFYGGRSLRIQMHDASGKLFPGLEIPTKHLPEVIAKMVKLALEY